jgi:hypothetical protein
MVKKMSNSYGDPIDVKKFLIPLLLALSTLSCWEFYTEPPVTEEIEIRVQPSGGAIIEVTVELTSPRERFENNERIRQRIKKSQRALLEGLDPWTRRFEEMTFSSETYFWKKRENELVKVVRAGKVEGLEEIVEFFGDDPFRFEYSREEEYDQIAIYPGGSDRATQEQRETMKEYLERWKAGYAGYVVSVCDLYSYLDDRSERAEACFGELFADIMAPERVEPIEETTEEEDLLLEEVGNAMGELLSMFEITNETTHSPNELSELIYDPFPAVLTIRVQGEILAVEGFVDIGEKSVTVPEFSLWSALHNLEDRWFSPDPFLALLPYIPGEEMFEEPFDLDGFLVIERRTTLAPPRWEVDDAVMTSLTPAERFLIRWRTYQY